MSLRTVLILLAVALIALGISIYRNFRSSSAHANSALIEGIGAGCANEVARVTDAGEVVVVTTGETDVRVGSFRKALKKHSRIRLTTHVVTPDPKERTFFCPLADFRDVLQKHRMAAALVFLVDLPPWEMVQTDVTEPTGPKLLVLAHGASLQEYEGYFQHGRLMTLITSRRTIDASVPSNPKTPQEWFAHDYEIITPQNYNTRLTDESPGRF